MTTPAKPDPVLSQEEVDEITSGITGKEYEKEKDAEISRLQARVAELEGALKEIIGETWYSGHSQLCGGAAVGRWKKKEQNPELCTCSELQFNTCPEFLIARKALTPEKP